MSQRNSGYARRPNEDYRTPPWLAGTIAPYLRGFNVREIWEPAAQSAQLKLSLRSCGFAVYGTRRDFFSFRSMPVRAQAIVTNPPYGDDRRAKLACDFIKHALALKVPWVFMLLRVDFDSAKTRRDLFAECPRFCGKITLLDRIKWFDGASGPSDNHAWFVWGPGPYTHPFIEYRAKGD